MTPEDRAKKVCSDPVAMLDARWAVDAVAAVIRGAENDALEQAAEIALAVDSQRGNEKFIAESIRALKHELVPS